MTTTRRFLVAPALARLIRREFGPSRIVEGHFPSQTERASFIRIEGGACRLVLVTAGPDGPVEERAEVPQAHGQALLDVCAGRVAYDRIAVPIGAEEALLDRFVEPEAVDLASVAFADREAAAAFAPPVWFGDEVTDDPDYANQALAVAGAPPAREVHLSNAALDAVLDLLDGRAALRPAPRRDAMESLRRAVAPRPAGSPVAALAQEGPRAAEAPRFAEGPRAAEAPRARFGLALAAAPERRFADPAAEPLREDEA